MGSGKAVLNKYISESLDSGHSFKEIEDALVDRGYTQKQADGIILAYKHRGGIIKWLTVGVLFVMFVSSMFLTESGIAGLVTLNYRQSLSDQLDTVVNESSKLSWFPSVKGEIYSVAVTGNLVGEGDARVYIEDNSEKILIFDSTKENIKVRSVSSSTLGKKILSFEQVCEESCSVALNSSIYNLVFEIDDAVLELESIDFDVRYDAELPDVPNFADMGPLKVNRGSYVRVDLDSYFNSSLDAEYSFLSEDNGVVVDIDGGIATVTPSGEKGGYIYFIAKVNDVQFMSNLVKVDVVERGGDSVLSGPIEKASPVGEPEHSFTGMVLVIAALAAILILALIPSRFFDIGSIGRHIDRIRKNEEISTNLKKYEDDKKSLKKVKGKEREKILDNMDKDLSKLSKKVYKSKKLDAFLAECDSFEGLKDKGKMEKAYKKLQDDYVKLMKTKIGAEEKKDVYKRMKKYYRKVNRLS